MSSKLKILFTVFLMVVFSASLMAGGNKAASGAPTIKYWAHIETPWNKDDNRIISAYKKANPNVKIEYEIFPYDEFESKTQTSLLSRSGGADVYKIWGGWAPDFIQANAFAEVPAQFVNELKADCYPPVLAGYMKDGKAYGVPLEFNFEYGGMLVLKPFFDKNKIAYPKTWDEMVKIATQHSQSSGEIFTMRGFDFISNDTVPYTFLSMILSKGGQFVTNDSDYNFNTPIAIEALQVLADLLTKNKVTSIGGLVGGGDLENMDYVFLGQALMAPRGMWVIPVGEDDYNKKMGKDFDYVAMPFYGPEKKWSAGSGWGLAVNNNSSNKDLAWDFVRFIMASDSLLRTNINCGMMPPRKSVATNPAYVKAVPYAQPIVDILDGAQYVGYYNTDVLKQFICEALVDVVNNGKTAAAAVVELNNKLLEHQ